MKKFTTCLLAAAAVVSSAWGQILTIPYKQDPPVSVDGSLNDWNDAKCGIVKVKGKSNLLNGFKAVPTEKDLSATFYFSWKPAGLFFAAAVKDDKLVQNGEDMAFFDGDHIELFLDVAPSEKDAGAGFGKKQFQIGFTPGNFANLKPAIYIPYPNGKKLVHALCAAERTVDGWNLEAFIPWKELAGKEINRNDVIGLTAWVSDTDIDSGNQLKPEHILTTGKPDAQFRSRPDLAPAVFADSNGGHEAVFSTQKPVVLSNASIPAKGQKSFEFTLKKPAGSYLTPVLRLNANIRTTAVFSGYARVLHIYVNGKELTHYNLLKPENDFYTKNGSKGQIFQKGFGYLLPYTKDGKAGNLPKHTLRFFAQHYNMHEFVLDLTGIVKEGKNTIVIKNTLDKKYAKFLDVTDIKVNYEVVKERKNRKPAPTGKIPVIKLKSKIPLPDIVKLEGSRFVITMKDGRYIVTSRFSTPDGKWVYGSNKFFRHQRKFEKKGELILVSDTFTNLTNENLPLKQEHTIKVPSNDTVLYLNGIETKTGKNIRRSIGNYSVFAGRGVGGGVGLYAINPEFQIHSGTFIPAPQQATLCDDQFVLPPGKTFTQQFVMVPLTSGSYYDFVNVVRRYLNINRTLKGPSCSWAQYKWMEGYYNRLAVYNVNQIIVDLGQIGTPFLTSPDIPFIKKMITKLRKVRPQAKIFRYYHSQIESASNVDHKDGRLMMKNGQQARYGHQNKLYLTLEGTDYAKMMEKAIDDLLENWDIDGIYWDEFSSSGPDYHYGQPWDQCSADIHPVTNKIITLKSSCWILQRPWKNRMADKIKAKGKLLVANGGDALMGEFANKVYQTFTETQFDYNNTRVHFSTPISYANAEHMDRSKFSEWYDKHLDAIKYGCLFTYAFPSQPHTGAIYHTVTDHLYPSTPMEIHNGYMIAEERIVTIRSGYFGWEDNSGHTIYVYDHTGREVKNHKLKTVKINGKTYSEIRLPQDWTAIIVRKK